MNINQFYQGIVLGVYHICYLIFVDITNKININSAVEIWHQLPMNHINPIIIRNTWELGQLYCGQNKWKSSIQVLIVMV